ncbi:MAG TPA: nuclear transport factor 2 family protein [Bacillales bacterium]|nr:nuclear transport factor 2 family protein [Bacillales bacterium]
MNASIKEQLYELELRHLQPEVRKSSEALAELLADDFIEFGSSGRVFTKQEIIEGLANSGSPQLVLKNFEVKLLTPGVALTRYRVERHQSEGQLLCSLRSAVWKLIEGRWQMVFHQGTPTTHS